MPIKPPRFKVGKALCAYCGVNVATDREDPIPINLYHLALRAKIQFLKIPSCRSCNFAKSQVDNAIRDYLGSSIESSSHPDMVAVINEKMVTAITENNVRLLDTFYIGSPEPVFDVQGKFQGFAYGIPADLQPVHEAVHWITRGLYWAVFRKTIPPSSTSVKLVPIRERQDAIVGMATIGFAGSFTQGTPFTTGWIIGESGSEYWAHVFFGSVLFLAQTDPMPTPSPDAENIVAH